MPHATRPRSLTLALIGFALTAFAAATGFGPVGGSTQSMTVGPDCYDIVTVNETFCKTTDCYELGCVYHYDCGVGAMTVAIAGSTWADTTEGVLYSLTCTKCDAIDLANGTCKKGGGCVTTTYTFKTPVGNGPCMGQCCF
ncbi:MAG: hypothetical protein ACF8Q5_09385 [Phycisphaerales bacterium JB040]